MAQPRISRLDTWARHEKKVLAVLMEALKLLQASKDLDQSEVALNRQLYFHLLEANRAERKLKRGLNSPPTPEAKNAPHYTDEERAVREDKVPDFSWGFIDDLEPDVRRSARIFVIECKRLGHPLRASWVFNSNYVAHGILRFIRPDHGYAKGERSAAMVGYVQSMELEPILNEVNTAASQSSVDRIVAESAGFQRLGITRLSQVFTRTFPISPFTLQHLWVDIRHCYGVGSDDGAEPLQNGVEAAEVPTLDKAADAQMYRMIGRADVEKMN